MDITLCLNKKPVHFHVTADAHETLLNDTQPHQKTAPMHNFLVRVVKPESKEDLKPFLGNAAHVSAIVGHLLEAFVPALEITLGE